MERQNNHNSKSLKKLIRSSFVIIGIFVVLSYGFATVALFRSSSADTIASSKNTMTSADTGANSKRETRNEDTSASSKNTTTSADTSADTTSVNSQSKAMSISNNSCNNFGNTISVIERIGIYTGIGIGGLIFLYVLAFWIMGWLCGRTTSKNEENIRKAIKSDTMGEIYLLTANAIKSAQIAEKDVKALLELSTKLLEEHSKVCSAKK